MSDPIRPDYYRRGGFEVADIADAYELPRWRTAALKYVLRAGSKDPGLTTDDLAKAIWHLQREINILGAQQTGKDNAC